MKSLLFILLFICAIDMSLPGCKTAFAPVKDVAMQTEVQTGMLKTDALYTAIGQASDKSYATYVNTYKEIDALIDDIKAKNEVRAHAGELLKITIALQTAFAENESKHQTQGSITSSEALVYSEFMTGYWRSLYEAEMHLK